ncbi:MAG: ABC transporter permease subunit [Rhizobiaceae bacterium]|nr:ABC transporter permease subunit [Rhizobiaceae bacterium]
MMRSARWAWAGLLPLLIFLLAFEIAPIFKLVASALTADRGISFANFGRAMTPTMTLAFANSMALSFVSALGGTVLGAIVAYAIITSRRSATRNALTALADVTANFGGAPLAFAFIITLGSTGVVTLLLKEVGINLYPAFRIYSIGGLALAYLYFQLPLAVLLMIPALLGLRGELREASTSLGATKSQYWSRVAIPILRPSLLGCFFLLFANAFGAYATAWTLTGSSVNLVTVQIGSLVRGEVQFDPALADAIAALSLLVMMICVAAYQLLVRNNGATGK